jgi:hypothetical protein
MGDEDDGVASLVEFVEGAEDDVAGLRVEVSRRLIGKDR